jgi:uncharacterized protein (TIGR00661 family)
MKILYGVVGEGMGHATRSKVIVSHLRQQGHDVKIVVSGRAHDYLKRFFPDVEEIHGLSIAYDGNAVSKRGTFARLLGEIPQSADNLDRMQNVHERFKADAVVSDFESFAYLFGQRYRLPVISIDNMQVMNRCELDVEIPFAEKVNFALAKTIVKAKLPGCHHYLITSFFFPKVRKDRTSLFPPILRDEIIAAKPRARSGEHVLVYQTADAWKELVPTLQRMKGKFIVYGLKRDQDLGHVQLRNFSEAGFIDDLASAKAVVTGGGFSLMTEAIFLGKPVLSVPIKKQFEQLLNGLYLEKLGYGRWVRELSQDVIDDFLAKNAEYTANVARHAQKGNELILSALDELLSSAVRG